MRPSLVKLELAGTGVTLASAVSVGGTVSWDRIPG